MFFQRPDVPHRCVVSSNMEPLFADLETEIEEAVLGALGGRTLAGCLVEMQEKGARRSRSARRRRAVVKAS